MTCGRPKSSATVSRNALSGALYLEFVARQNDTMDRALSTSDSTLEDKARVIAVAHIDCVLAQGREIPGLEVALLGSVELEKMRTDAEEAYVDKCRATLAPFRDSKNIEHATMWAIFGAANGLAYQVTCGKLAQDQAQQELYRTILAVIRPSSLER